MEKFFNALSLPALFFLLWKSGLPDHDLVAMKQYYDSAYMVITHNDGCKSARIPLRRGVRQGCPLSPILGCIVINMLIRWVEDAGGGMSHLSGVITKIMLYCDDTTLTTEDLTSMQGLFERTYTYCQWVVVNINHGKSEVVGYDFKSQKAISTDSLKLGTNNLRQVAPSEPVKFLGTRVTIKLDMTPERTYIIQKVKEWSKVLNKHPYHPSQVNWITQIAVLAIVKFSTALAQWDDVSIRQLDTVI